MSSPSLSEGFDPVFRVPFEDLSHPQAQLCVYADYALDLMRERTGFVGARRPRSISLQVSAELDTAVTQILDAYSKPSEYSLVTSKSRTMVLKSLSLPVLLPSTYARNPPFQTGQCHPVRVPTQAVPASHVSGETRRHAGSEGRAGNDLRLTGEACMLLSPRSVCTPPPGEFRVRSLSSVTPRRLPW